MFTMKDLYCGTIFFEKSSINRPISSAASMQCQWPTPPRISIFFDLVSVPQLFKKY